MFEGYLTKIINFFLRMVYWSSWMCGFTYFVTKCVETSGYTVIQLNSFMQ